eukprot:jgi/Mesvir1/15503/Mv20031-RA.1
MRKPVVLSFPEPVTSVRAQASNPSTSARSSCPSIRAYTASASIRACTACASTAPGLLFRCSAVVSHCHRLAAGGLCSWLCSMSPAMPLCQRGCCQLLPWVHSSLCKRLGVRIR